MIDERKLIEVLEDFAKDEGSLAIYGTKLKTIIYDCIIEVENQPKIGDWIPCNKQLPKEGQKVLATHERGINPERQVIEHVFLNGEFLNNWDMDLDPLSPTYGQRYMGQVIAWMPKPDPYEE